MSDALYEKKLGDMQKYVPFLENLIQNLKRSNDEKREGQLNKMQMFHDLLTNKNKKLKLDTLEKCELVLIKLQKRAEMLKVDHSPAKSPNVAAVSSIAVARSSIGVGRSSNATAGSSKAVAALSNATVGLSNTVAGSSRAAAGSSNAAAGPSNATAGSSNATAGSSNAATGLSNAIAGSSKAVAGLSNAGVAKPESYAAVVACTSQGSQTSVAKVEEQAAKLQKPTATIEELATKILKPAAKIQEPPAKIQEPPAKIQEPAVDNEIQEIKPPSKASPEHKLKDTEKINSDCDAVFKDHQYSCLQRMDGSYVEYSKPKPYDTKSDNPPATSEQILPENQTNSKETTPSLSPHEFIKPALPAPDDKEAVDSSIKNSAATTIEDKIPIAVETGKTKMEIDDDLPAKTLTTDPEQPAKNQETITSSEFPLVNDKSNSKCSLVPKPPAIPSTSKSTPDDTMSCENLKKEDETLKPKTIVSSSDTKLDSEDCSVTSTTAIESLKRVKPLDDESDEQNSPQEVTADDSNKSDSVEKNWIQGALMNLFNPGSLDKTAVLGMLEKVVDGSKFEQIKAILSADEPSGGEKKPSVAEKKPGVAEKKPSVAEKKPSVAEKKPNVAEKKTSVTEKKPSLVDKKSCVVEKKPCVVEKKPSETEKEVEELEQQEQEEEEEEENSKDTVQPVAIDDALGEESNADSEDQPLSQKMQTRPRRSELDRLSADMRYILATENELLANQGRRACTENKTTNYCEIASELQLSEVPTPKPKPKKKKKEIFSYRTRRRRRKKKSSAISTEDGASLAGTESSRGIEEQPNAEDEDTLMDTMTDEQGVADEDYDEQDLEENVDESIDDQHSTVSAAEMTLEQIREVEKNFKNIHSEMHSQSKYITECAICKFSGRFMSSHYMNSHNMTELVVSRLPPDTLERVIRGEGVKSVFAGTDKHKNRTYTYTCPFCELNKNYARKVWSQHFGSHTGEYKYKCSGCGYMSVNVRGHIMKYCPNSRPIMLENLERGRTIVAHICKLCNYIQMSRDRVVEHLRTQHGIKSKKDGDIQKLTLFKVDARNLFSNAGRPRGRKPGATTKKTPITIPMKDIRVFDVQSSKTVPPLKISRQLDPPVTPFRISNNAIISCRPSTSGSQDASPQPPDDLIMQQPGEAPLKNIYAEMHSQSVYALKCIVCQFSGKALTKHYKRAHPEAEVFTSRIPPERLACLMRNESLAIQGAITVVKYKNYYVQSACPFCCVEKASQRFDWVMHFAIHTGEYKFRCSKCNHYGNARNEFGRHFTNECPGGKIIRLWSLYKYNEEDPVLGYFCKLCKYIQMSRNNVVKHLKTQHNMKVADNVEEVVLFPGNPRHKGRRSVSEKHKRCKKPKGKIKHTGARMPEFLCEEEVVAAGRANIDARRIKWVRESENEDDFDDDDDGDEAKSGNFENLFQMEMDETAVEEMDTNAIEDKSTIQNIHPEMHALSEQASKCVLCSYTGRYISKHYLEYHAESEIFTSRLPPDSQRRLLSSESNLSSRCAVKSHNMNFYFKCPFCNVEKDCTRHNWVGHFAVHTGEYKYKCSECCHRGNALRDFKRHFKTTCRKGRQVRTWPNLISKEEPILGYFCNFCNYIQMERQRVVEHLQTQHGCFEELISKITLLYIEPNGKSIQDEENKTAVLALPPPPPPPTPPIPKVVAKRKFGKRRKRRRGIAKLWSHGSQKRAASQRRAKADQLDAEQLVEMNTKIDEEQGTEEAQNFGVIELTDSSDDDAPLIPARGKRKSTKKSAVEQNPSVACDTSKTHAAALQNPTVKIDSPKNPATAIQNPTVKSELPKKPTVVQNPTIKTDPLKKPAVVQNPTVKSDPPKKPTAVQNAKQISTSKDEIKAPSAIAGTPATEQTFMNTNSAMHSRSEYATRCVLCPLVGRHLTNHYINFHPRFEVPISRLPPSAQCSIIVNKNNAAIEVDSNPFSSKLFTYNCLFCDTKFTFTVKSWVDHFGTHTGEYNFKCSDCGRMINSKRDIMEHIRQFCRGGRVLARQFPVTSNLRLLAYICKLCNYIQMNRGNVVHHLRTQHKMLSTDPVMRVILLRFCQMSEIEAEAENFGKMLTPKKEEQIKQESNLPTSKKLAIKKEKLELKYEIANQSTYEDEKKPDLAGKVSVKEETSFDNDYLMSDSSQSNHSAVKQFRPRMKIATGRSATTAGPILAGPSLDQIQQAAEHAAEQEVVHRISQLGYSKNDAGMVKYHCCVRSCTFQSTGLSLNFEYHIVNEHSTLIWEGYCRECGGHAAADHNMNLSRELQHLFEHTKKRPAEPAEKSAPVAKVARVSPVATDPRNLLANRPVEAVAKPQVSEVDESASSIIARFANNKNITITRESKPVEPPAAAGTAERQPKNIVVQQQVQQQVLKEVKRTLLKPWTVSKSIKSEPVVKDLLRDVSLFAFFKCMGCNCPFTTNDSNLMAVHLNIHSGHSENRGTVESSNVFSWLECCYCSTWAGTVMQLIAHITAKHSRDIYQCPYCFYRSCEEYNVIVHLRHYHADVKETILYCFGRKLLKVGGDVALQTLKKSLCSDCTLIFMNPLVFASHIAEYTDMDLGGDIYKCYYCSKKHTKSIIEFARHIVEHRNSTRNADSYKCFRCFKHQTSIGQLSNKHNIKCYQCVHCAYSTDEELQMNLHMAQVHASNLLFCGLRIRILANTMGDDVSTRMDNGAAFILLKRPVDERILFRCPYTPSQLNHMSASIEDQMAPQGYQDESLLQSLPGTNCPIITQNPGGLQIAAVTSITSSAFASLNDE